MKDVQRTESTSEKMLAIIKFAYYFLALPCLMIVGIAMAFIAYGTLTGKTTGADSQFYSVAVVVWLLAIVPLSVRRYAKHSRSRQLKKMVEMLSNKNRFAPKAEHQLFDAGRGKYFGIDTQRGTLLYIHMVKKGVADVVGFDMRGWTNRELDGSVLNLYTRNPEVPVISINAHPVVAKKLYDTLGAMSHNRYEDNFPKEPWADYVRNQSRFIAYDHEVVVPQAS
ncbi:plasmid IncI1-type surface exclusion protein ExcA [Cronobacter sakazakii]|uniref:plasmid IncI1-type surface exclusion protein ExcA n=1 Tax=Cronobacter sakazakii TaxID=28141 RepID=UPI0012AA8947|nr:plasmid IncI1-type surface exclusion protein ExcA [Cronobacter sakazakii]EKS1073463.1 plasmid IncI1-type surface exclusion protein ExcA [Cronobacter sakazakii]EKS1087141.1 plasmid IncI1-type surface exclusion protein ExcA [Cronobacter sakazakii]ELQ5973817.1 plasmid IncI1-type surface exclusion protein ExcA [Cronobacter sakazakii]ELQ6034837.1 plasmid IncI1-type surface exclusion protein ExcA [Cronobacter sakazakii]ELQ6043552.1 plasmid IncI1-type surface exclusion protein ExcA [Cronobacter sa